MRVDSTSARVVECLRMLGKVGIRAGLARRRGRRDRRCGRCSSRWRRTGLRALGRAALCRVVGVAAAAQAVDRALRDSCSVRDPGFGEGAQGALRCVSASSPIGSICAGCRFPPRGVRRRRPSRWLPRRRMTPRRPAPSGPSSRPTTRCSSTSGRRRSRPHRSSSNGRYARARRSSAAMTALARLSPTRLSLAPKRASASWADARALAISPLRA